MELITIRKARRADLETLLGFEQSLVEAERPYDMTLKSDEVHYYDLEELISSPQAEIVVAEADTRIVGSGYARIEDSKPYLKHSRHAYLGFMYVVPGYRGKGVNKKIIEFLETWSDLQGVTEMRLEVYGENAAALRAYEKSGYTGILLEMRKGLAEN